MSAQHVTATGGFAYGAIGADIHVFGDGTPLYLLRTWCAPEEPDSEWIREQPSRMLNARFAVVPFTGRENELASLRTWCTGGPPRAARWLHGQGGQGKTRLAHQLAHELRSLGWKAVTAVEGPGSVLPPPGSQDLRLTDAAGLLLVVDYADRWSLTSLTWLFSNALLHQPGVPTRVLLLARDTTSWPALRAALANEQVSTSTQELSPLSPPGPEERLHGTDGRREMFHAALHGFAARYGLDPPSGQPDLTHADFGLTLAVHMAALVAVDARAGGRRAPQDLAGLTVYLLDREQLTWTLLHDKRGQARIATPPAVMNRTVFAASLGGAQPSLRGAALVDDLGMGRPTAGILADHAVCYPPPAAAGDTVLEPLYPDRLAEDFVALTLPGHPADYPAQPWAADTAATVLRHGSGPARPVMALAAAAARWPHVGPTCLYPLLAADPGLGVSAGGAALTALAGLPDIEAGLLEDIASHLPDPAPADLAVGRATVLVRLLEHRLGSTGDPAVHARLFVNHGNHLDDLGRTEEALEATQRAAALFGELAAGDPRRYEEHLGRALTNVAGFLSDLGRRAEALSTQERVLELFERLTATDPETYEPHLATALANLAAHQEGAGRWEEAHQANERAARIYRALAERDPQYRRGLAIALTNAAALTFTRPDETSTLREAVELSRQLAAEGLLIEETTLADSLLALYRALSRDGDVEEAVGAARDAVAITRRLAEAHPLRYAESHGRALGSLRSGLLAAGRSEEAVSVGEEQVALWRRLAHAAPDTYEDHLVGALHEQNTARLAAGLPEDPEARARSREVDLDRLTVRVPTIVPTVHRSAMPPFPRRPRPARRLGSEARALARARDWSQYWALLREAPLVDAARMARRIPRRGWLPADPEDRDLLDRLRATSARRSAALIDDAVRAATRPLPEDLHLYSARYCSFSRRPGSAVLAVARVEVGRGQRSSDRREIIETLDLDSGRRRVLSHGPANHGSLACLGSSEVVAVRSHGGRDPERELVRHGPDGTTVLARDAMLTGMNVVATADGFVGGLALAPAAIVQDSAGRLRNVNLGDWGLTSARLVAVAPGGDRLVLCDGYRLVATDARFSEVLAAASADHTEVRELIFADEDLLLTTGSRGGVVLWQWDGLGLHPLHRLDTPPLSELAAVPVWGIVCGIASSKDRVRFFDTTDGLRRCPAPDLLVGDGTVLKTVAAPPGGRFVAYSGWRHRSSARVTRVHDLHHPASVLQRPLVPLTDPERSALARAHSDEPRLAELFGLAHALADRPAG
ncbi:tetratricopeptide repeat protein [Streptomyces africanus]|uniref:tetratricopeptide repeat protein n=1 Tax=Streptomyces africanus TaxID=231024 RepID=UPI000A3D157D|nr:tetratricopeptide repeat protein [Streptomyces africanus]